MTPEEYFKSKSSVNKKRYDAMYDFFINKKSAAEVAKLYGYTILAFYTTVRDFRKHLKTNPDEDFFFKKIVLGRKPVNNEGLNELVISLRKKNYSVHEIVSIANSKSYKVSYWTVYKLLIKEGFARLPRRSAKSKNQLAPPPIKAPVAEKLELKPEKFNSSNTGLFAFLPIIYKYGIHTIIEQSAYPCTKAIDKISSILCFLALKLSNIKRYSHDDFWCMDRGMGLFAGLNVLPKNAWFSSYSSRVDTKMNLSFLKALHHKWLQHGLLSDTSNLDFTTIPYWGDSQHLENNWSGKRGKALESMLAVLAQDPDNGIIDYGNCNVTHQKESSVVLEYLDFYRSKADGAEPLKYLVFDSKFTNYQNLSELDRQGIKFITIRRRGEKMIAQSRSITDWKTVRVEASGLKKRTLKVNDTKITLSGYKNNETDKPKTIRQIIITGHGKIKPAIILTNDFDLPVESVVRKYCRRWLVEKGIAEQIDFFHLNRVSSSMVIKVDFDMVMTILAHNLYRLLAMELERYKNLSDDTVYRKFIANSGEIEIEDKLIRVELKKKRELPQIIEYTQKYDTIQFPWLDSKKIYFCKSPSS